MAGNYPAGVTDDDPYFTDESEPEDEEDDPEYWTCAFPDRCLMPSDHSRDECHTVEDAEQYYADMEFSSHPERKQS